MSLPLFIPVISQIRRKVKGIGIVLKGFVGVYFLILSSTVFSQSCPHQIKNPWEWPSHSNWFIGMGLKGKFKGGNLIISSIPNITLYEGTSGASDDWGNLLFLNNGRRVWDAQGNLKYSGLLEGDEGGATSPNGSASQGVITVRHPLDTTNYYIFTVDDALTGKPYGLNYSVVDRTGTPKGGATRLGNYRTTEGVAATRHANGVDLWVTVQGAASTNYYTYLITCSGVVPTPVISAVASSKTGDQERGGLAFSWDSKLLVSAHPDAYPNSDKEVSVYKFDNKTGIISDPHHISSPSTSDNPYDVIFSTDNSRVYFTNNQGDLQYYDVSSWNTTTMMNSLTKVAGVKGTAYPALEIGGDGNLYMANFTGLLGKLSGNMNTGTVTYSTVAGAETRRGLPTMYLPPFEEPDIDEIGPFCSTDPPVDLSTKWICSGIDAEDPVKYPDSYNGPGITDKGKGIFDPKVAGEGNHMIIFKRCSVDDTIFVKVRPCGCPDTSLKPMPPICAYDSLDLNKYVLTNEPGQWMLVGMPAGSPATVNGGHMFYGNHGTPGKYTVRYTINKKVPGCPDYAERDIILHPVPVVTATGGIILCNGQSIVCSASGANTYTWSNGGFGASISVTPLATTSYTVTGTDANGCMDTSVATVVVPPKLELVATSTNVNCLGKDNGTASISASGGTPGYTYVWSNGQTQPKINGLSPGNYTVVVSDSNKCADSVSVVVTAPVLPTADFIFSTGCLNTPVEFSDNSTGGSGTITFYKWDFGDPLNPPNENFTRSPEPHLYTSTGTYTVKLLVVTDGGCKDSITKPVDVWPKPKVDFGSPKSGCKPVCVNFQDFSTISSGSIVKWNWNFGDASSGSNTSTTQNPEHCYYKQGLYHVSLTVESDKGCKDKLQKNDLIEVFSSPVAEFTSNVKEAEIFNPTIQFYDKSSGSPVSWHWDFGVTTITDDTSKILTPKWTYADTGKYNVCLTVKNIIGCSDYICHPITINPYWTFYIPNAFTPNGDGINDSFNGTGYNIIEYQLWIYDRWGNMIYTTGETENPASSKNWDGRANDGQEIAQQDVYVWKVQLRDVFKKRHHYIGTVTIVK